MTKLGDHGVSVHDEPEYYLDGFAFRFTAAARTEPHSHIGGKRSG
jgi:hypothetical protein